MMIGGLNRVLKDSTRFQSGKASGYTFRFKIPFGCLFLYKCPGVTDADFSGGSKYF